MWGSVGTCPEGQALLGMAFMPGAAGSLPTADGHGAYGVNGRLDSEMLVHSQTPENPRSRAT